MSGLSLLWTHQNQTQMVIQMRTFVAASWLNADENDYSGKQQSHMVGRMANLAAYADDEPVKKAKKVKAPDYRTLEQKREDFLDRKRVQFEKAFENGEIGFEQYEALLTEWEKSRSRLDKRMGIVEESKDVESKPSHSILPRIERVASTFASCHPFATLVGVIVLGSMVMNVFGFGA